MGNDCCFQKPKGLPGGNLKNWGFNLLRGQFWPVNANLLTIRTLQTWLIQLWDVGISFSPRVFKQKLDKILLRVFYCWLNYWLYIGLGTWGGFQPRALSFTIQLHPGCACGLELLDPSHHPKCALQKLLLSHSRMWRGGFSYCLGVLAPALTLRTRYKNPWCKWFKIVTCREGSTCQFARNVEMHLCTQLGAHESAETQAFSPNTVAKYFGRLWPLGLCG